MSDIPERHPEIPADARWRLDLDKWEVVALDAAGARTGEARFYRPDGTLYMRAQFVDGREDGAFAVFHPSGEIAREGRYSGGELDGDVVARVARAGEGEPLRSCCVPEPAVEMRTAWDRGQVLSERFFDGEGRLLLADGSLCPPRPANLPETADYDEGGGRWIVNPPRGREAGGDGPPPLYRFYRQDGSLDEEATIENGWKTFARLYASDGSVRAELRLGTGGRREGAFFRRFVDGEASPFRDPRIAEERGSYGADAPVGRFTYHDAGGALLHTVDHGTPGAGDEALARVLADDGAGQGDAEAWETEAAALAQKGLVALSLVASARAAARRRAPDGLLAAFAQHTVALAEQPALELATKANEGEGAAIVPALLSALVAGGDPAELLRALSAVTPAPRAALDLVEAAVLLDPERPTAYLTRALARIDVGEDGGALADARTIEPISEESAAFVRLYVKTLFPPEWGFWPARERFDAAPAADGAASPFEGVPDGPAQPPEAIVALLQVYATRLQLLRDAVIARAPKRARAAWLPPALPALLPAGPVALRNETATITDETDEGPVTSEVVIDETLDPALLASAGVSTLMRCARAQWAALTWLCWSCGLSRVALPGEIAPPASFPAAAVAGITRYFRVQDALVTGGLRSRTSGVPSVAYQDLDIDELPRPVAEVALDEARELRALYLWLLSPENHSPFQSDLREDG
jgi:hypothetical protein